MKDEGMDEEIYLSDIVNYVKHIISILYTQKFLILGFFVLAILVGGTFSFIQPQQYNSSVMIKIGSVSDPIYQNGTIVSRVLLSDEYIMKTIEKEKLGDDPSLVTTIKDNLKISELTPNFNIFELSLLSTDKNNGTRFIKSLSSLLISDSEGLP
ncbi:Wzz/FepE/Etk N-terminal domain-containing protein [Methanospirillum sp.]